MKEWLALCFTKPIVRRAGLSALVVGAILTAINHGDAILHNHVNPALLLQIILTLFVPYVVSTISSVSTIFSIRKETEKEV